MNKNIKNKSSKRAVIYARYSSDKQTEQSIEGQLRVCQKYADDNNLKVIAHYIDRAQSGTNDNRQEFQRMISDSFNNSFDCVIVYKLDRFSRNIYESVTYKHTLKQNNVSLLSAMEGITDTPEGALLESMLMGFNEYFSKELSQKVKRGLNESLLKGKYPCGAPPYGYKIENHKAVIVEEEAKVVRRIFQLYIDGYNSYEIENIFKVENILTRIKAPFQKGYIIKILNNIKYTGHFEFNGSVYNNIIPKIIEPEVFEEARKKRVKNDKAFQQKMREGNYLLSGLLYCGLCRHKFHGATGKGSSGNVKYYYRCVGHYYKKCLRTPIKMENLDKIVISAIHHILKKDGAVNAMADYILEVNKKDLSNEEYIESLQNEIETLENKIEVIIDNFSEVVAPATLTTKIGKYTDRIEELKEMIDHEKKKKYGKLTKEMVVNFLKNLYKDRKKIPNYERYLVTTLLRAVVVYDKKIIIMFKMKDARYPDFLTDEEFNMCDEIYNKKKSRSRKENLTPSFLCSNEDFSLDFFYEFTFESIDKRWGFRNAHCPDSKYVFEIKNPLFFT